MTTSRTLPFIHLVAAGLAGLALAACGGRSTAAVPPPDRAATASASPAAEVTARNGCDLLTRADAESAVGQPLPQNTVNVALGMCDHMAADFSAGASLTVGSWESIRNAAIGGGHQPVALAGVGDEGLYFVSEQGAGPIYVRRGNEGFLLTLHGPRIDHMTGAEALGVQKELALKILKRF